MSIKNRTTLKSFFQLKDRPNESQFSDLIDSQFNLNEDSLDDIPDGNTNKLITSAEKAKIHDPKVLGTKEIDESAIGNNKLIKYNSATDKLEFVDPGSGSGDMTKAVYDTDNDGIVDKAETVDDGAGNSSTAANIKLAVSAKHTHANQTALDNVSGTNTGDQTLSGLGGIAHSLATAVNDFLVASGAGAFVKKTLAEVKIILGLGSAAYTASTDYVAKNTAITGATKTKITYDVKGLVTSGDNATQDDIGDGLTNKQYSSTDKSKLAGIEANADVTDTGNVGSSIHGSSAKTSMVDADEVAIIDTEASNVLKTLSWAYIKSILKTYFDGLYALIGHNHTGTYEPASADFTSKVSAASDSAAGKVELATTAETDTGTDTGRAVTPEGLAGSIHGLKQIQIKVFDDATALATGDGKLIFMIPEALNGMNLVKAHAAVTTVSSSGTPIVQVRNVTDSQDMLSTRITIDASEYTSYTAATAPVIDTSHDDVATGDLIAIDVDGIGTGAKGLIVYLAFQTP
ncbi:MAG: hypothetical protein CSYNP_03126 [Syntrophus sp. SKADARSKE-3]|nr:hypothetical protein [Syntrophus sp. SKADARSKE-3]